jgi:hypothetical protein
MARSSARRAPAGFWSEIFLLTPQPAKCAEASSASMHGQKDRQHPKASRTRRKPYHEGATSLCGETLGWALDVYTRERLSRPLRHSAIRLRDCPLGSGSRVNFLGTWALLFRSCRSRARGGVPRIHPLFLRAAHKSGSDVFQINLSIYMFRLRKICFAYRIQYGMAVALTALPLRLTASMLAFFRRSVCATWGE